MFVCKSVESGNPGVSRICQADSEWWNVGLRWGVEEPLKIIIFPSMGVGRDGSHEPCTHDITFV